MLSVFTFGVEDIIALILVGAILIFFIVLYAAAITLNIFRSVQSFFKRK